jgi:hypothetical protein
LYRQLENKTKKKETQQKAYFQYKYECLTP